jgi:hypothetical protein
MATTFVFRPCSPLRVVTVHLLSAAGDRRRVLFLDREGRYSSQPHPMPRREALILASNQRIVLGRQAAMQVL